MRKMELIAPCHFGLEAVLRREITDLGYEISEVEDGRITFLGDEEAVCRAHGGQGVGTQQDIQLLGLTASSGWQRPTL